MYGKCLNTEQTSGTHTIFWMNMNMKLFMDGDSLEKNHQNIPSKEPVVPVE